MVNFFKKGPKCSKKKILINKFEIIDGNPEEQDIIPFRLFLDCYSLSTSFKNLDNIFSVKYYLKFVIIDSNEKEYFQHHEIYIWRNK